MVVPIITAAIKRAFPETEVYDEEVPQGFTEPSFFVRIISSEREGMVGRRHKRTHKAVVRYFADNYEAMRTVAERLLDVLEYPEHEGACIHGTKMNYVIEEDALHFFFDVNEYFDKIAESGAGMKEIRVNDITLF